MTAAATDYARNEEDLPRIRKLDNAAPARWLAAGVEDLKTAKLHSLAYGLVFTIAGLVLIWQGLYNPVFTLFILCSFVLAAPLAAVGLYDISRRIERNEPPSLLNAISAFRNNTLKLVGFAFFLGVLLLAWAVVTGSVVHTIFGSTQLVTGSWSVIVESAGSMPLVAIFMLGGLVMALIVAAISIISIPIASQKTGDILTAAVILIILLLAWLQLTALVFGLFFDQAQLVTGSWSSLYNDTRFLPFIAIFIVFGGLLASFVFVVSVFTIPHISDKNVSAWVAVSTSIRAVLKNPGVMARWAATLALLVILGMGFFFIGLVLTLPLAGHASWHAYRETILESQATPG